MANTVINNIRREKYTFRFNDNYLADTTKNVVAQRSGLDSGRNQDFA